MDGVEAAADGPEPPPATEPAAERGKVPKGTIKQPRQHIGTLLEALRIAQ